MTTSLVRHRLQRELRDLVPASEHARILAHYEATGTVFGCGLDPLTTECLELAAESARPLAMWEEHR